MGFLKDTFGSVTGLVGAAIGFLVGGPAGAAAGFTLGSQADQQRQAAKMQRDALDQASSFAQRQNSLAEQQINAANRRRPNLGALQGSNRAADMMAGGTLLTGPAGVDPNQLQLGKQTLLGG